MGILVINCGSSSLKFAHFEALETAPLLRGSVEAVGTPTIFGSYTVENHEPSPISFPDGYDHHAALSATFQSLQSDPRLSGLKFDAVGHRVVHGGQRFSTPLIVGPKECAEIRDLAPLAPVHALPNALGIESAINALPNVPQVAVFDTGFHQTIAPHIYRYALPSHLYHEHQVRRYGFHGTSHQYVSEEACRYLDIPLDQSRLISAHLGNGCSATAILNGLSVDTSMGLTPLEGLTMGTRSGTVDPNLHSYLARQTGMSLEEITTLLNQQSGLLGVSGLSNDLRLLAKRIEEGCQEAQLAVEIFTFRLAREIAGLTIALEGKPDALIFTGGIGENSHLVRRLTLRHLAPFGFELDDDANLSPSIRSGGTITRSGSPGPTALVIPTDEERAIAKAAHVLISASLS
ncbi:MAG: acetate/propionate family kinase [Verrucomicrobiales bacterium]